MLVYNRNKDGACSTAENDSYPCLLLQNQRTSVNVCQLY